MCIQCSGNRRSSSHKRVSIFFLVLFSGDTDQVVRDLFGPLVDQLIHWFTRRAGGGGRSEVRRKEAECLLTAILSGLSNDEEGTGKCLLITRYSNGFNLALKLCSAVITVELTQLIFC